MKHVCLLLCAAALLAAQPAPRPCGGPDPARLQNASAPSHMAVSMGMMPPNRSG